MGVSKNSGIPKWMVYNGKPYQNGWFGGTPIFWKTFSTNYSLHFLWKKFWSSTTSKPSIHGPGKLLLSQQWPVNKSPILRVKHGIHLRRIPKDNFWKPTKFWGKSTRGHGSKKGGAITWFVDGMKGDLQTRNHVNNPVEPWWSSIKFALCQHCLDSPLRGLSGS